MGLISRVSSRTYSYFLEIELKERLKMEDWMIADSQPAELMKPPTISPRFSTINTSTNHLHNKFRKSKLQPPSLTIIDVNQLNLQKEHQFDKSKPATPTKSNWQGEPVDVEWKSENV